MQQQEQEDAEWTEAVQMYPAPNETDQTVAQTYIIDSTVST